MNGIGLIIKYNRERAGMTRKELAEITGFAEITITKYEDGDRLPGEPQLRILADAFGVSIEIFREPPAIPPEEGAGLDIKAARERAGMSRTELAMRVGVTESTIYRYETGRAKPKTGCMARIAEALRTTGSHPAPALRAKKCFKPGKSRGETLLNAREAAGLARTELATRIGVTETTLIRYENDLLLPSLKTLRRMANAFGMAADELERMLKGGKPEIRHVIGENIREARQAAGMTLAELGKHTAISSASIQRYEKGIVKKPDPDVLRQIAAALDVTVESLAPGYSAMAGEPASAGPPPVEPAPPKPAPAEPVRWLGITAPDGTETRYFHGRLSELLYQLTPEGIESVTAYAEFVHQQERKAARA